MPGRLALVLAIALLPAWAHAEPSADDPLARIVPPQPLGQIEVEYPAELVLRPDAPDGEVIVRFVVGIDGITKEVAVERGLDPQLDALAIAAVEQLKFTPASLDGEKVEIVTRIAVPFHPPPPPKPVVTPDDTPKDATVGAPPIDSGPLRLSGRVLEAGQRTPIEGATILVVPAAKDAEVGRVKKKEYLDPPQPKWTATRRADEAGQFALHGLEPVKVRVVVLAPGFERLEYIEELSATESIEVTYWLKRLASNPYRTVVVSSREQREEVARRTITPAEIGNLPGTQGDALKALQNFPGIARAPFGLGLLAIRGTGPNDSAVFLGWHEIPLLFHFGGLTSVFNSDILERIDFVPGNYDTRYGDALGGIIDVQPRKGRRDGYHGYVDSDLFDTGVLVEGRVGKGSFAIAARRSYIDLLLPAVIPDDAGIDLTLAPRYWDDQILFDYPVGGGELSVRVFGSRDRLKLVAADPNEIDTDERNRFETSQYFHRVDLVYRKKQGAWDFLITPSYRYDTLGISISDLLKFDLGVHNLGLRSEISNVLSKNAELRVGTELRAARFEANVAAPPIPPMGAMGNPGGDTGTLLRTSTKGWNTIPALYASLALRAGERTHFYPGVRLSYYSGQIHKLSVEPRLRAAFDLADRTILKAGVGMVAQAPQPVQASDVFGNPRVGLERGVQTSVGVSQTLPYAITVDGTVFFTYLWDQIVPSPLVVKREDGAIGPETFANTQKGRAYGLEILARKQLTGSVFAWVAYTLNRSERQPLPDAAWRVSDFDQTHILTIVGVWKLPKNWQIGGRFRLVSGNPYTPYLHGVKDESTGDYLPISGPINSQRLPLFHQLDLRIDKSFVWRRAKLSLYLDVQNVYNHQNSELKNWAYDFSRAQPVAGLPIIPSLGTKIEF
ncbi:MAG TPA: TonB-dependent receptor [Nannocystaceae bacterium]|nr:TonB-dependent receptor [Nannocystaceae bacterium]